MTGVLSLSGVQEIKFYGHFASRDQIGNRKMR